MEAELVTREGIPFEAIPAAGVHGVGLSALPGNLWRLYRGFRQARRLLRRFQPQVMFFTGGFVAVPVALAGRLPGRGYTRPHNLLYVPDIEPGLALKTLARFADRIAVTVEDSRRYFSPRAEVVVSGYPTRANLDAWSVEAAREAFDLSASLSTLLVLGGSKGARSINRAVLGSLEALLSEMQVLHVSGKLDWAEVEQARSGLPIALRNRYKAYPYLHAEMGAALRVADLAVARAGASTLGELPLFALPAILVPYPYAWRYQQVNAEYLAERGAAVILQDSALPSALLPTVQRLMGDADQLRKMRAAMGALSRPAAGQMLAKQLVSLAAGSTR